MKKNGWVVVALMLASVGSARHAAAVEPPPPRADSQRFAPATLAPVSFGAPAAMDGDAFAVGTATTVEIYERGGGGSWTKAQTITRFASALVLSGDTLAIANAYDSTNGSEAGVVAIYRRGAGGWALEASLFPPAGNGTRLGNTLSLAGDHLAAGTGSIADAGIFVFERTGTAWSQVTKLGSPDPSLPTGFRPDSIAIDGDALVAGLRKWPVPVASAGRVFVWRRGGGVWGLEAQLTSAQPGAIVDFGARVKLSGDTLVASLTDLGIGSVGVDVLERRGGFWTRAATISNAAIPADRTLYLDNDAVALRADTLLLGTRALGYGADSVHSTPYLFRRYQGEWKPLFSLPQADPPADGEDKQWTSSFGYRVAVSDRAVLVTDESHGFTDPGGSVVEDVGQAYVFEFQCASGATDWDGDGVCEADDNCPALANPLQIDTDGDGIGNGCDTSDCASVGHTASAAARLQPAWLPLVAILLASARLRRRGHLTRPA